MQSNGENEAAAIAFVRDTDAVFAVIERLAVLEYELLPPTTAEGDGPVGRVQQECLALAQAARDARQRLTRWGGQPN